MLFEYRVISFTEDTRSLNELAKDRWQLEYAFPTAKGFSGILHRPIEEPPVEGRAVGFTI
jgi:hypothetical protein